MTPQFFPRDRYYCLLDEQPDHLVPARLLQPREGYGTLIINPLCWFGWHGSPPADMARRMVALDGLYLTPWMVWVDDPATRSLSPFWLGPELAHVLVNRWPGEALGVNLPEHLLNLLWNAEIVVTPDHVPRRRHEWTARSRHYAALFPRGYVALDRLIHPFHLGALRRYFRHQMRHERYPLGDGQAPGRCIAHDEPVARFFHRQLTQTVSDATATLIDPSYSYVTLYQPGADLPPHTDREQCEYTLSLSFDSTPEPEAQVPWPLGLMTAEGALGVWQFLGDGLLFRGRYLNHWRSRIPDGHTASSILFHYVDLGFPGSRS
jgi:hypothetical protein